MPRVTIELVEGRTVEVKRQLAREITEVVCRVCSVPATSVSVLMQDMPKNSYAKAGVLICDQEK